MTAFLAWVYSVAWKVYQWFGSAYSTLYNGALNAWNWAVTRAQDAYNSAVSFILNIKTSIMSTLNMYIDWLTQRIDDLRQGVIDDLTSAYDWIAFKFSQIDQIVQNAVSNVIGDINNIWASLNDLIADAIGRASSWLQDWVLSAFNWLLTVKDRVLSLLGSFNPQNVSDLFTMLSEWKSKALLFFSNPLAFILDLIEPYVLEFLQYVIAWALGTTDRELPTTRNWKGR